MNTVGNESAKETMLAIQLRSLFVVYADRKMPSVELQMDGFAILHRNLDRFARTRQSFFIAALDIKLIFSRFRIDYVGSQGKYGTPYLTIKQNCIIVVATEVRKYDF